MRRRGVSTLFILCCICLVLSYFGIMAVKESEAKEKAAYDRALVQLDSFVTAFVSAVEKYPDLLLSADEFYRRLDTHNNQIYIGPIADAMGEFLDESQRFAYDEKSGCYMSNVPDPWGGNFVLTLYPFDADVDHYVANEDTDSIAMSIWCSGISERLREDIRFHEHSSVDSTYVGVGVVIGGGVVHSDYHCEGRQLPFYNQKICLR